MGKERGDLLQGTLDMLVLKALQLQPMHGWASLNGSSSGPRACCSSGKGRSIPPCIVSSDRD